LVNIWKASKSAVFNLVLIIPVVDRTICVIVFRSVQWIDLTEVISNWSRVVGNNIDHNSNTFGVSGVNKSFKIIF